MRLSRLYQYFVNLNRGEFAATSFQLPFPCRRWILPSMSGMRMTVLSLLLFTALAAGIAADGENLLVESYGKLLLIRMDGTKQVLVDSMILAALSPDGRNLAFTHDENPRALSSSSQILSVMPASGGVPKRVTQLPRG